MTNHDQLALARAVRVFDAEDYYRQQLARLDAREEQRRIRRDRLGNFCVGLILCMTLGGYVVFSFAMGAQA